MKIVIGSLNKTKVNAVKTVFEKEEILTVEVPSGVSAQPVGDEETLQGATNRARGARKTSQNSIGIGLEGGVMFLHEELYLCNWGAIVTPDGKLFTAGGARIQLPRSFIEPIEDGIELSDVMNDYAQKSDIRHHEGAIGIFTNGQILRDEMFAHVVTLLKGQMDFWSKEE